jgi:hypothetical protein
MYYENRAMKKITQHRERILDALNNWFHENQQSPTLEELCRELEMSPHKKATLQRWLQTMRGTDVEWLDNVPRSLRLLKENSDTESELPQLSIPETLRYLATGLADWERQKPKQRDRIPEALRMGMSRMYLTSLLQGEKQPPENLPEFLAWSEKPLTEWSPSSAIAHLSDEVTLIEDGLVSDFTNQWQVTGQDTEKQVQEQILREVLDYCRQHQLDKSYRTFRKLIIEQPVLSFREYRRLLSSSELRPLREFLKKTYLNLVDLDSCDSYHFCPRCQYVQRQRHDGSYGCRNIVCGKLAIKQNLPPRPVISAEKAEEQGWKVITPGVYIYGTLPGLWEIYLADELEKLGLCVTLWPEIDEYDLLVEFDRKLRWAIDVKDWKHLYEEGLKKVEYRLDAKETFIVFPDERDDSLRVKVVRKNIEPSLSGVKLRLISEIITNAKQILKEKK